jgi:hypothetical protein
MKRLTKQQKVVKYLAENRVFPLSESATHEMWGVEGQVVYNVMFHKVKGTYTCSCKNVRLTDCTHIVCVKEKRK